MKFNSTKLLKKGHLLSLTLIAIMFSCDFNNQESNLLEKEIGKYEIDEALTNVKLRQNGVSANINTELIREIALKENGTNDISMQELDLYTMRKLRNYVQEKKWNRES